MRELNAHEVKIVGGGIAVNKEVNRVDFGQKIVFKVRANGTYDVLAANPNTLTGDQTEAILDQAYQWFGNLGMEVGDLHIVKNTIWN